VSAEVFAAKIMVRKFCEAHDAFQDNLAICRTSLDRSSAAKLATQDSLGCSPISANLRVLGLYAEGLSRRDSVKVAQYEVLGNDAKRPVPSREGRSKRSAFGLAVASGAQATHLSSLRDGRRLKNRLPSTSYWATFTKSLRDESSAHTLSLKLTLMRLRRRLS
jgi:hypothetical protein